MWIIKYSWRQTTAFLLVVAASQQEHHKSESQLWTYSGMCRWSFDLNCVLTSKTCCLHISYKVLKVEVLYQIIWAAFTPLLCRALCNDWFARVHFVDAENIKNTFRKHPNSQICVYLCLVFLLCNWKKTVSFMWTNSDLDSDCHFKSSMQDLGHYSFVFIVFI